MTTLRQIEANRRNAQLSTGPTSPEGKDVARRNSCRHGLTGVGDVLPEGETALLCGRTEEWIEDLRPRPGLETWLVGRAALFSLRLDQCAVEEISLRDRGAKRAAVCWETDRRVEVEALAEKLWKNPGVVAAKLRESAQGCRWLIERWEALGRILETGGDWTEAHLGLALDMLGVPLVLRCGATPLDPEFGQPPRELYEHVARHVVKELRSALEGSLIGLDGDDQALVERGTTPASTAALTNLRKYEKSNTRELRWALELLETMRSAPAIEAEPIAAAAKPVPSPPAADLPKIVLTAPAPLPSMAGTCHDRTIRDKPPANRQQRRARVKFERSAEGKADRARKNEAIGAL